MNKFDASDIFWTIIFSATFIGLFTIFYASAKRNETYVQKCIEKGGIPVTDSGIMRICLAPNSIIHIENKGD